MKINYIKERNDLLIKELLGVWEASVLATHDFLPKGAAQELKPLVEEGLKQIDTLLTIGDERPLAFMGGADKKIEMLFVEPKERGKGLGKKLVEHAIKELSCNLVDVNEQNPQAIGFYEKMGFKVISRSDLDNQGNPYPILHMRLYENV